LDSIFLQQIWIQLGSGQHPVELAARSNIVRRACDRRLQPCEGYSRKAVERITFTVTAGGHSEAKERGCG
jgi:hypothetical protein